MSDIEPTITEASGGAVKALAAAPAPAAPQKAVVGGGPRERRGRRTGRERGGRRGGREERVRPEFDSKTLTVRRVARVVAGGRRFNFSALLVLGNRKGSVGVGTGKAADTALAIEKATRNAKKNMLKLGLTKSHSIPHELYAKYSSARVKFFPSHGKGLIAGSAVRAVLELGGVNDVNAKILSGSKNKLNIARAAIKALSELTNHQRPTTNNSPKPEERP